jgi:hypothetical protein
MRLAWLVLSALLLAVVGGCQQEAATNTPPAAAIIEIANLPAPVSLLTLARNPVAFEGEDLILSGNYQPLPVPVCSEETHRSPATWILSDGEIEIPVAGFDSALRDLAPAGLPMEVEGRWQKWEGPVGCGRRAPSQTVWHLQLVNILSPNPLSASLPLTAVPVVATTPVATQAILADGGTPVAALTATATSTDQPPGVGPTATSSLTGSLTPAASSTPGPSPSGTTVATVTPFPTFTVTGTVSVTPNGTTTPTGNAPTPTPTSASGSSPTPTVNGGQALLLDYDDLNKRTMTAGSVQEWQFAGAINAQIILSVAPENGLDVALELLDPSNNLIDEQDLRGPGQVEVINEDNLPASGLYTLRIASVDQSAGSYALIVQNDSSRPIVLFRGILAFGETRAGSTPINGDHLWHFEGFVGDVVNILVTATTAADVHIYLNNHDGRETEFVNDNSVYHPPDDREEILSYRLPATGLYTIGIGEEDLEALGYIIVIERDS